MRAACVLLLCLLFTAPATAQTIAGLPDYKPPVKLSNGGRPEKDIPFPAIRDLKTLVIRYSIGDCGVSRCDDYAFELRGDGTLIYNGMRGVAVRGMYRERLGLDVVRRAVQAFQKARFYWLFDRYAYASYTDLHFPEQEFRNPITISIAFDGQRKKVLDDRGAAIGMPRDVFTLQQELFSLLGMAKYVGITDATLPLLRAARWDFHGRSEANIALLGHAIGVTEFEGPIMVRQKVLDDLMAAGVPVDNYFGCGVLAAAARTREAETVAKLLAADAPVQAHAFPGQFGDCDALEKGAEGGDPDIVRQLLAHHPDPNWASAYGRPLLGILQSPGYVPGKSRIAPIKTQEEKAAWDRERDEMLQNRATLLQLLLDAGADPRLPANIGDQRTTENLLRSNAGMTKTNQILDAWAAAHPQKSP